MEAWAKNDYKGALKEAQTSLAANPSDEIETKVKAEVSRILKETYKIDVGESNTGGGVLPNSLEALGKKIDPSTPEGKAYWKAHKEEIQEGLRAGKFK